MLLLAKDSQKRQQYDRDRNAVLCPTCSCGTCLALNHIHSQIGALAPAHPFTMGRTMQALLWLFSNTL